MAAQPAPGITIDSGIRVIHSGKEAAHGPVLETFHGSYGLDGTILGLDQLVLYLPDAAVPRYCGMRCLWQNIDSDHPHTWDWRRKSCPI